ncbi:hypothetical protein [Escherichia coli]
MSGGDGRGPGNTGLGHNGGKPSGNVNGSSGHGGPSSGGGYHYDPGKGPASTVGPDGEVHINITGGMKRILQENITVMVAQVMVTVLEIITAIQAAMEKQRLFLDGALTLGNLADIYRQIKIS